MITEQTLLDAGFVAAMDYIKQIKFYQKRVLRDGLRLYFINVYHYKHEAENTWEAWELDMAFDRDSKSFPYTWIKVAINPEADVEDIFSLAQDIFNSNDGIPYEDTN